MLESIERVGSFLGSFENWTVFSGLLDPGGMDFVGVAALRLVGRVGDEVMQVCFDFLSYISGGSDVKSSKLDGSRI